MAMVSFSSTILALVIGLTVLNGRYWLEFELAGLIWWQATSMGGLMAIVMCLRHYQHRVDHLVPLLVAPTLLMAVYAASWAYGSGLQHLLGLHSAPWVALYDSASLTVFGCLTLLQLLEVQNFLRHEHQIYQAPWQQAGRPILRYAVPHLLLLVWLQSGGSDLQAVVLGLWLVADLQAQHHLLRRDTRLKAPASDMLLQDEPVISFGPWQIVRPDWHSLADAQAYRFLTTLMPLCGAGAEARRITHHVTARCQWSGDPLAGNA